MAKEYFSEQQQFNQPFLWIMIGIGVVPVIGSLGYGVYIQIIMGEPWGEEPMSDLGLLLITLFSLALITGIILLIKYAMLETQVNRWGVRYRYTPLIRRWKEITKSELQEFKIVKYSFRGYGIRWGLDGIKTLNVKGNKGIEFLYGDNKKIIIGTQQPDLFFAALDKMKNPEEE